MNHKGISHGDWCHAITRPWRCSACRAQIYFFSCDCGSKVFFDELRGNWPEHQCCNKASKASDAAEKTQGKKAKEEVAVEKQRLSGGQWLRAAKGSSHWLQTSTDVFYLCGLPASPDALECKGQDACPECESRYMKAANRLLKISEQNTGKHKQRNSSKNRYDVTEHSPQKGWVRFFG